MNNKIKQIPDNVLVNEFVERMIDNYKVLEQENQKLREALIDIVKVVEFYSDSGNWKSGFSLKVDDTKLTRTNQLRRGGKRARQALEAHKELIETISKDK
jgi:hypothetical protein